MNIEVLTRSLYVLDKDLCLVVEHRRSVCFTPKSNTQERKIMNSKILYLYKLHILNFILLFGYFWLIHYQAGRSKSNYLPHIPHPNQWLVFCCHYFNAIIANVFGGLGWFFSFHGVELRTTPARTRQ